MQYLFRQKYCDETTVLLKFEDDELPEIVSRFRDFLLGCGFGYANVDGYVPDPYDIPFSGEEEVCPIEDEE
jgi:hypothetical protein